MKKIKEKIRTFFSNFGKREELVYIVVFLWISMGVYGAFRDVNYSQLAAYFGSLTAYVATYIWGETKRPSEKSGLMKPGPNSRREVMIYAMVFLWTIVGAVAIWFRANLNDLAVYFLSLSGFVATWIAGEVYKPQDTVKKGPTPPATAKKIEI